jgi:CubicO group peptidase (beta-lactamase class C family)
MSRPTAALLALGGALLLAMLATYLSAPLFWQRYLTAQAEQGAALPAWYQPRELLAGAYQPPAPRVTPELESIDAHALEAAAAYAGGQGSLALIVARHDHIVFERYWQGSGFDTLIDSQSFTRVLAALATGSAIAQRQLGWPDEPLSYLVQELRQDRRGAITLRNLLEFSSALAPVSAGRAPWSGAARALYGSDITALLLAQPLAGVPGEVRMVQPSDPQLLSLALERGTGERYATYLSQVLWQRLGASDAWLYLDRPGGAAHADCCLVARQGDWMRVAELVVADGNYRGYEVIRPGWIRTLRTPTPADHGHGYYLQLSAAAAGAGQPYLAADTFALDNEGGHRLWLIPSLQLAVLCTARAAACGLRRRAHPEPHREWGARLRLTRGAPGRHLRDRSRALAAHAAATATATSMVSPTTRTAWVGSGASAGGPNTRPSRMSKEAPCSGHTSRVARSRPSHRRACAWVQMLSSANSPSRA